MKYIKNVSGITKNYQGQDILDTEYQLIPEDKELKWSSDSSLLTDIANNNVMVSKDDTGTTDITDVSEAINYLKSIPDVIQHTLAEAMSSNVLTKEDKTLYTKIHGIKADVLAGITHTFELTVPYGEVYFQGAELLVDIIGVSDFHIWHPTSDTSIEQYGYDVNMGTIKYVRESKYAARIPQGLVIRCDYTNDTTGTLEVGINFLLHEIRS